MGRVLRKPRCTAVDKRKKAPGHCTTCQITSVNTCKENGPKAAKSVYVKEQFKNRLGELHSYRTTRKTKRQVLGDKTNESPSSNFMSLRTRKNIKHKTDVDSSSTSTVDLSLDLGVIRSPRSSKSNNKSFSIRNLSICPIKKSFVLLENIDELDVVKNYSQLQLNPTTNLQKTCVYKTARNSDQNLKPVYNMLPEEKLALYEFEVDENEPKRVIKKRKRKPRKKIIVSDTSDDERSPLTLVVKQLRNLTTTNISLTRNLTNKATSPPKKEMGTELTEQVLCQTSKLTTNRPILVDKNKPLLTPKNRHRPTKIVSPSISPIPKCDGQTFFRSAHKTVQFADGLDNPSANSTPQTSPYQKIIQDYLCINKTMPSRGDSNLFAKVDHHKNRGVSSVYVHPNANIRHNFVLDDSTCLDYEAQEQASPKTPKNARELTPVLRQRRSRQVSIQRYFSPTSETNSSKANLDASGLFDENSNSPDLVPHSSRSLTRHKSNMANLTGNIGKGNLWEDGILSGPCQSPQSDNMSFNENVTKRKRYKYVPRVSSFEPRDSLPVLTTELNVENFFGFEEVGSEEEIASLCLNEQASGKRKMKRTFPASSTPYARKVSLTKPKPERISVHRLKEILAPFVAKKPVVPGILPEVPTQSTTLTSETPVQCSVSSHSISPCKPTVSENQMVSANSPKAIASPLLFTDPNIMTPVSFADDPPSQYFSKPARKSYEGRKRFKRTYADSEHSTDDEEIQIKKSKRKRQGAKPKENKAVAQWVADINSQFSEIEDMELCVE